MRRRLTGVLAGLAVLLALYAGLRAWLASNVALDEKRLASAATQPAALPELEADFLPGVPAAVTDFVERPLFWAERRPPDPEAQEAAPEPAKQNIMAPKDLEITGVVKAGGAWFAVGQFQGQPVRVREGESLGNWRVTSIMDDNVKLNAGNEELVIEIFKELKVQAAAPARRPPQARRSAPQRPVFRRPQPQPQQAEQTSSTEELPEEPSAENNSER